MTTPCTADDARTGDIERFRAILIRRLGLQFEETKDGFLRQVLHRRLGQVGETAAAYLQGLDTRPGRAEMAALACELTVGETYFFRNSEQFRALAEIVLPERMAANGASRTLRLLSAGCASGEEAYSLAITARETIADPSWSTAIRAVDINPAALEKAARARYSAWALRETPAAVEKKWFRPAGRQLALDPAIQAAVRFEERNLAVDDAELWQSDSFDIVFCRNVLIYFAPEPARALIARFARALRPGGYLFLGHAETLRGISGAFQLRHTHGTFYYQLEEGSRKVAGPCPPSGDAVAANGWTDAAGDAWFDAIRQASDRIAALAAAQSPPGGRNAGPQAMSLAGVFDLLRLERFAEALDLLRLLVPASSRDPDILLLEAILLAHGRRLPAAEEACRRLLAIDGSNAAAHYVLALCRESAGDHAEAAEYDRAATSLDLSFAMPRLHLGLLARRAGDRETGQRELAQALVLLKHEDPSRLLLFGGGFNRDALVALCASALRDCGGEP
ncbi:MAG TPA: CheR family methyltransferase [Stellaceae bacterium]|nr:CheR family methyltransferase [Stellaceae bacterium]